MLGFLYIINNLWVSEFINGSVDFSGNNLEVFKMKNIICLIQES